MLDFPSARLLIAPTVPDELRPRLMAAARSFEVRSRAAEGRSLAFRPGSGPILIAGVLVGVVAGPLLTIVRSAGTDVVGLPSSAAWLPAVVGVGVPVLVALGLGGLALFDTAVDLRTARLVRRWSGQVITAEQQCAAAAAFPEIGQRLRRLDDLVEGIREHDGLMREGWLPGVTPAILDGLHYTMVRELLDTRQLRTTIAEAAERPALVERGAIASGQIAAVDAAVDARLDELVQLHAAACCIADGLRDMALADQLAADQLADGALNGLDLRHQLPVAGTDLAALVAGARATADLVRDTVYPADTAKSRQEGRVA